MPQHYSSRKVVIVGAGDVGATFAYSLAQSGTAEEICLVDLNSELLEGQVLDLSHGLPFYPPVRIKAGSKEDYSDAQVIVITAGSAQKKGESRLDLLQRNAGIIRGIMDDISGAGSSAVVVMVTNPVDVLTKVALEHSGWDRRRIFGSGTVLDSSRFRYLISKTLEVGVHNVHAYILGEHGDSEFAAWSLTNIGGVPIDYYCQDNFAGNWAEKRKELVEKVRNSAYHVIDYKGATNFAVGLALVRITGAVLRNQSSVLTVSAHLQGEYAHEDICISVPCLVNASGMSKVLKTDLSEPEIEALGNSVGVLKNSFEKLRKHA